MEIKELVSGITNSILEEVPQMKGNSHFFSVVSKAVRSYIAQHELDQTSRFVSKRIQLPSSASQIELEVAIEQLKSWAAHQIKHDVSPRIKVDEGQFKYLTMIMLPPEFHKQ